MYAACILDETCRWRRHHVAAAAPPGLPPQTHIAGIIDARKPVVHILSMHGMCVCASVYVCAGHNRICADGINVVVAAVDCSGKPVKFDPTRTLRAMVCACTLKRPSYVECAPPRTYM